MLFQTSLDPLTNPERVFRVGVSGYTATLTITAGSIAIGSPVVLETGTASLAGNYVRRPATSTSIVNNLFVGNVHDAPGTKAYLDREEVGLIQCYGIDDDAIVQILTAASVAGQVLLPESLQFLIPGVGPVTAAATGTAANVEQPAIGGLAYLMEAIASSAATSTQTNRVFLRCM